VDDAATPAAKRSEIEMALEEFSATHETSPGGSTRPCRRAQSLTSSLRGSLFMSTRALEKQPLQPLDIKGVKAAMTIPISRDRGNATLALLREDPLTRNAQAPCDVEHPHRYGLYGRISGYRVGSTSRNAPTRESWKSRGATGA
jgi:hypothetical protein